jgi:hypothetical protein
LSSAASDKAARFIFYISLIKLATLLYFGERMLNAFALYFNLKEKKLVRMLTFLPLSNYLSLVDHSDFLDKLWALLYSYIQQLAFPASALVGGYVVYKSTTHLPYETVVLVVVVLGLCAGHVGEKVSNILFETKFIDQELEQSSLIVRTFEQIWQRKLTEESKKDQVQSEHIVGIKEDEEE